MDTSELVTYVKRTFGDESGVQVEDADVIRWINAAQREAVMHNTSLLQTTSTIDIVQDQDEYSLPSDMLVLRSMRLKLPGMTSFQYIESKNLQEFDKHIAGWDGDAWSSNRPFIYTVYNDSVFLFPKPNQASLGGLKVLYSRKPTELTNSSDPLDLPDQYHNAIIKFCLQQANEMDEDYEASTVHAAQFKSDVDRLSFQQHYGARETYPVITVNPDDAW